MSKPLDPSTPLRLVTGERSELERLVELHVARRIPVAHPKYPYLREQVRGDMLAILDALIPPLGEGEEPMTVRDMKRASLLAVQSPTEDADEYDRDFDISKRIEQEVRRATGGSDG